MSDSVRNCFMLGARAFLNLYILTVHLALFAVPFILIEDKGKPDFWYCTGAWGLFLFGVSSFFR